MSKSFYKEALLDIVTEALEQPDESVIIKHTGLNELKKALKQAQKQEKLLNQIKDIINRPYDIASMLEESKRYVEIENLIKEIENDIK